MKSTFESIRRRKLMMVTESIKIQKLKSFQSIHYLNLKVVRVSYINPLYPFHSIEVEESLIKKQL